MNVNLATASSLVLDGFTTDEICAMNNALTGFGRMSPGNLGFKRAKDASLIKEDGRPLDSESLLAALGLQVSKRLLADE